MRKLIVLGMALALSAGTAFAQVNKATLYSTNAKGSLLVFADIDISGSKDTIIRLVNDGDSDVLVKCMWLTWEKARADFVIRLTAHQPVIFNAVDGGIGYPGNVTVNPFPTENPVGSGGTGATVPNSNYGIGELKCWAVGDNDGQVVWNHLSGTGTVIDFANGTAYEYAAAAFYGRQAIAENPGVLVLDGNAYDKCPLYLIGQFSPVQDPEGIEVSRGLFNTQSNRLAIANCRQDLRQDWRPRITKLQFDVFNGYETKFTGSWECADSFHVTSLGAPSAPTAKPPVPLVRWALPSNFRYSTLGTKAAYFRVQGVASTQCNNVTIWGPAVASENTGLVGVLSSVMLLNDETPAAIAVTLVGAGTSKGTCTVGTKTYNGGCIEFDLSTTSGPTPEAR